MRNYSVGYLDRFISALTYITAGWGGLIYTVIMYFAKKKISSFTKYNIFQSIFISALYFCIAMILGIILKILSYIPFLNYLVAQIAFTFNKPFFGNYSIIQGFMTGLIIYLTVLSAIGKIPRIYKISNIIDNACR